MTGVLFAERMDGRGGEGAEANCRLDIYEIYQPFQVRVSLVKAILIFKTLVSGLEALLRVYECRNAPKFFMKLSFLSMVNSLSRV